MEHKNLPHDHGYHNEEEIMKNMPGEDEIAGVSEAMKQLGDPSRLRIFWLLCHCEECVLNIAALVNMTSPAVSHHLRLLKGSGLIVSRREGKEMYYRTADRIQSSHGCSTTRSKSSDGSPAPSSTADRLYSHLL